MALVLKESSNWWYARLSSRGKLRQFSLTDLQNGVEARIQVKGRRPPSLKHPEEGDRMFMMSYARAKAAHDQLKEELRNEKAAEKHAEKLMEASTGETFEKCALADMAQMWLDLPRKKKMSKAHQKNGTSSLQKFITFVRARNGDAVYMEDVSRGQMEAYLRVLSRQGFSARTWNFHMGMLKQVYREFAPRTLGYRNYLEKMKRRDEKTVHREPFTHEEFEKVLEAARREDVIGGPVIVSAYTGLRRGDACVLKWSALDKKAGFLQVSTRKSGEMALVPILPPLASEISKRKREGEYIFPEAANLYLENGRGVINARFSKILEAAGFDVRRNPKAKPVVRADVPRLSKMDTDTRVKEVLEESMFQKRKTEKMKWVYQSYAKGQSVKSVARELSISPSTVSLHLNTLEELAGCAILRGGLRAPLKEGAPVHATNSDSRVNRASVKGWHSLRTTFITRALEAGMPEELLRKVTGHATVDVVREHYFDPSDEVLAEAFQKFSNEVFDCSDTESGGGTGKARPLEQKLKTVIRKVEKLNAGTFEKEKSQIISELNALVSHLGADQPSMVGGKKTE